MFAYVQDYIFSLLTEELISISHIIRISMFRMHIDLPGARTCFMIVWVVSR